jgi:hypothetical protein
MKPGIALAFLIGTVLITLKLVDAIGWSWWLVLLPFYAWTAAVVMLVMTAFLVSLCVNQ